MRRIAQILKGQKVTSFADGHAHGNASQRPTGRWQKWICGDTLLKHLHNSIDPRHNSRESA